MGQLPRSDKCLLRPAVSFRLIADVHQRPLCGQSDGASRESRGRLCFQAVLHRAQPFAQRVKCPQGPPRRQVHGGQRSLINGR